MIAVAAIVGLWQLIAAADQIVRAPDPASWSTLSHLLAALLTIAVLIGGVVTLLRLSDERERQLLKATEDHQLALLGRMSAVLAHELRNPLTSAKGHSQLLAEMLDEGARTQIKAQHIVRELMRLEALTDKLIRLARSGRIHPRADEDPRAIGRLAARRIGQEVEIEVVVDADAPARWSLDAGAFEQVLTNLLRNAGQAQAEHSKDPIVLTIAQRQGQLYFSVRDHGPGLASEEDLFAPFVTTRSQGLGLGLALSQQIVRAHGGRITLHNHPDGGALAEIHLPPRQDDDLPSGHG